MFDPEVAQQLFTRLCGHRAPPQQVGAMVAEWAASRRERRSQVHMCACVWLCVCGCVCVCVCV